MAKRRIGQGGGDFPETWRPDPGDRLIGKVTRKDEVTTQYGLTRLLEIDDANVGTIAVFCGSTVLSQVWGDVNEGDLLDLTYQGEVVSEKSGRTFKSYLAEVDDGEV
jgi:hypothetical protein